MQVKALSLIVISIVMLALCAAQGYAADTQKSPGATNGSAPTATPAPRMKTTGNGHGITVSDYEKCVSFCQGKFNGSSPELTACIQGCSKVPGTEINGTKTE